MSLSNVIGSIRTHVDNAYSAIDQKHGAIPENKNIENLAFAISTIDTKDNYARLMEKTTSYFYDADVKFLPSYTFCYNSALTVVDLPNCSRVGISNNDYPQFAGCNNLKSLYFSNCYYFGTGGQYSTTSTISGYGMGLTTLSLPNASFIGAIGSSVFADDGSIMSFPDCLQAGSYAFYYALGYGNNKRTINLPNLLRCSNSAFAGCSAINAPNLTYIDQSAFTYNVASSFNFPRLGNIPGYTFNGCTSLQEINIPAAASIGTNAFLSCPSLKSIILPGLYYVGNYSVISQLAFGSCSSLSEAYIFMYNSIRYIYSDAFSSTPIANGTGSIYVPESKVATYKTTSGWRQYSSRIFALPEAFGPSKYIYAFEFANLGSSLTEIPSERLNAEVICPLAFSYVYGLTEVSLPQCKSILPYAFSACYKSSSTSPTTATDVGISSLNIPAVEYIGIGAFHRCELIPEISCPECTWIDAAAFYSCRSLSQAYLPKVEFIGNGAFSSCPNLSNIDLPACKFIMSTAFGSCENLLAVNAPNCIYIESYAFSNCTNLKTVNMPSLKWAASAYTFYNCNNLSSISIPNCLSLGTGTFGHCQNLSNIDLPKVHYLDYSAFTYCTALTDINIPNCRYIGYSVFNFCQSLPMISLPACSYIGIAAFSNCHKLSAIYLTASSVCALANINAFFNTPITDSTYLGSYGSIYVPASLVTAYKEDTTWGELEDRIVGI